MMIDVDHFKSVNDRFGHPVGDAVLQHLAIIAQQTIRTDDYFARYGPEGGHPEAPSVLVLLAPPWQVWSGLPWSRPLIRRCTVPREPGVTV
ncbi:MAG: GGDEF domain-containing protein [Burkholderiales bacterium]